MRQLTSFLLIALALPVVAADAWRWKDEKGVVHYSDRPVPGAERITLAPGTTPPSTAPAERQIPPPSQAEPAAKFRYSECKVVAPGNDQVFNAVNTVTASVQISPTLRPGHGVQVILDGDIYAAWPAQILTWKLVDINRGTHTLRALVLDAGKQALCEGPAISFHVRQPSILAPARQPQPKQP